MQETPIGRFHTLCGIDPPRRHAGELPTRVSRRGEPAAAMRVTLMGPCRHDQAAVRNRQSRRVHQPPTHDFGHPLIQTSRCQAEFAEGVFIARSTERCPSQDVLHHLPVEGIHRTGLPAAFSEAVRLGDRRCGGVGITAILPHYPCGQPGGAPAGSLLIPGWLPPPALRIRAVAAVQRDLRWRPP